MLSPKTDNCDIVELSAAFGVLFQGIDETIHHGGRTMAVVRKRRCNARHPETLLFCAHPVCHAVAEQQQRIAGR